MARTHRKRMTIDLRGLGPALRAHAKARRLTLAAAARSALAAALQDASSGDAGEVDNEQDQAADHSVKLTLRLRRGAANRLATRARAAGLPYGAYLATLLDGTPAPPLAANHEQAVTALGASTERLAIISADINELIRTVGRGGVPAARQLDDRMVSLARDVRQHLVLASRLMAALQPAARPRQRSGRRPDSWRRAP